MHFFFTASSIADGGTLANDGPANHHLAANRQLQHFVSVYIEQNNKNLSNIKKRGRLPLMLIDSIFKRDGLPVELKYMAVVESELNTKAVSRVGAAGPWQFMPATARILGLKVGMGRDERKNFTKSTKAAARYLKDLHAEFGDWFLVMAAYNCGEGPVYSAIKQAKSRNYWKLQHSLPPETREYVKKFYAIRYYFEGGYSLSLK